MTPTPCACGRPGCLKRPRDGEKPYDFRNRRYASRSCARWHRNMTDVNMADYQSRGAKSAARNAGYTSESGAIVTSVAWLFQDDVRLRVQRQAQGIRL